jgi:tape measure domain-containing protein
MATAQRSLDIILNGVDKTGGAFRSLDSRLGSLMRSLFSFKTALAGAMGGGSVLGGGLFAVKLAGEFEMIEKAMTQMTGSAETAKQILSDIDRLAAKSPFDITGLQQNARLLLALGVSADRIVPTMKALADATAAMGGNTELLDRMSLAFGQMLSKGRLQAEEFRQLAEAGIPAWKILSKVLGVDIPTAQTMVEKRMVDSAKVVPAMIAELSKMYGGMNEALASTTLGSFRQLRTNALITLRNIGKDLSKELDLANLFRAGVARLRANSGDIRKSLASIFGSVGAGLRDTMDFVSSNRELVKTMLVLAPAVYAASKAMLALNLAVKGVTVGEVFLRTVIGANMGRIAIMKFVESLTLAKVSAMTLGTVGLGAVIAGLGAVTAGFVRAKVEGISFGEAMLRIGQDLKLFDLPALRQKDLSNKLAAVSERLAEASRDKDAAATDAERSDAMERMLAAMRERLQLMRELRGVERQQAQDNIKNIEAQIKALGERPKVGDIDPDSFTAGAMGAPVYTLITEADVAYYDKQLAVLQDKLQRFQTSFSASAGDAASKRMINGIAAVEKQIFDLQTAMAKPEVFDDPMKNISDWTGYLSDMLHKLRMNFHKTIYGIRDDSKDAMDSLRESFQNFVLTPHQKELNDLVIQAQSLKTKLLAAFGQGMVGLGPRIAWAQVQEGLDAIDAAFARRRFQVSGGMKEIGYPAAVQRELTSGVADSSRSLTLQNQMVQYQRQIAENTKKTSENNAKTSAALSGMLGWLGSLAVGGLR